MFQSQIDEFEDDPNPARYDIYYLYATTGVRPRRVYFYIQQRLIPKAIGSGPAARYSYEHVVRLKVLEILKERGLLLREIRIILDGSTVRELHHIAQGRNPKKTIENVRRLTYRSPFSPPSAEGQLTRVAIAEGVELLLGETYVPRAAVRLQALIEAITDILDVRPPKFG